MKKCGIFGRKYHRFMWQTLQALIDSPEYFVGKVSFGCFWVVDFLWVDFILSQIMKILNTILKLITREYNGTYIDMKMHGTAMANIVVRYVFVETCSHLNKLVMKRIASIVDWIQIQWIRIKSDSDCNVLVLSKILAKYKRNYATRKNIKNWS